MKKKKIAIGLAAFALVLGGGAYVYNQQNPVPELVTYVDQDSVVQIQEDETPLAKSTLTFVDLEDVIIIEDDEVPLAKATVPQLVEDIDPDDDYFFIPDEYAPL